MEREPRFAAAKVALHRQRLLQSSGPEAFDFKSTGSLLGRGSSQRRSASPQRRVSLSRRTSSLSNAAFLSFLLMFCFSVFELPF